MTVRSTVVGPPVFTGDIFRTTLVNGWYRAGNQDGRFTGNAAVAPNGGINQILAVPFWSGKGGRVKSIALQVVGVAGAGGLGRCGIYKNIPGAIAPGVLLVDGGQFVTDANGLKSAVIDVPLLSNTLYWLVHHFGVSVAGLTIMSYSAGSDADALFGAVAITGFGTWGMRSPQAFGPLPANFPLGGVVTLDQGVQAPLIAVQYSSYPQ